MAYLGSTRNEAETTGVRTQAVDLAKLKKLEAKATPSPWEADDFTTEDGYGQYRAFHVVDAKGRAIFDTSNSELQIIHDDRGEGPDGPEGSRWDETGRLDTAFIAEMRNATPGLIATVEELRDALEDAYRFISQPRTMWNDKAEYDTRNYNALTAKLRAALSKAQPRQGAQS